jgi:hypothetical protein
VRLIKDKGNDRRETRFGISAKPGARASGRIRKTGKVTRWEGTEELEQRWIKAFQQWVKSVGALIVGSDPSYMARRDQIVALRSSMSSKREMLSRSRSLPEGQG